MKIFTASSFFLLLFAFSCKKNNKNEDVSSFRDPLSLSDSKKEVKLQDRIMLLDFDNKSVDSNNKSELGLVSKFEIERPEVLAKNGDTPEGILNQDKAAAIQDKIKNESFHKENIEDAALKKNNPKIEENNNGIFHKESIEDAEIKKNNSGNEGKFILEVKDFSNFTPAEYSKAKTLQFIVDKDTDFTKFPEALINSNIDLEFKFTDISDKNVTSKLTEISNKIMLKDQFLNFENFSSMKETLIIQAKENNKLETVLKFPKIGNLDFKKSTRTEIKTGGSSEGGVDLIAAEAFKEAQNYKNKKDLIEIKMLVEDYDRPSWIAKKKSDILENLRKKNPDKTLAEINSEVETEYKKGRYEEEGGKLEKLDAHFKSLGDKYGEKNVTPVGKFLSDLGDNNPLIAYLNKEERSDFKSALEAKDAYEENLKNKEKNLKSSFKNKDIVAAAAAKFYGPSAIIGVFADNPQRSSKPIGAGSMQTIFSGTGSPKEPGSISQYDIKHISEKNPLYTAISTPSDFYTIKDEFGNTSVFASKLDPKNPQHVFGLAKVLKENDNILFTGSTEGIFKDLFGEQEGIKQMDATKETIKRAAQLATGEKTLKEMLQIMGLESQR